MATLTKDQYQLNSTNHTQSSTFGTGFTAQTFTPSVTGNLNKLYLEAYALFGTPADGLKVAIQGTSSGEPDGSDLASETIAAATVAAGNGNLVITFSSPPSLTAGTQYAIVLSSAGSSGAAPYNVGFSHTITTGTADYYDGGNSGQLMFSTDSGSTWPDKRDVDIAFVTEMDTAVATPGIDLHAFGDDESTVLTASSSSDYIAQTFEPTVSADLKKVALVITKSASGGDVTLEIQGTSGGEPDGSALATETISNANIETIGDNENNVVVKEITFSSPASLISGTKYAIVLKFPGTVTHRVGAGVSTGNVGSGNAFKSTNGGSSWTSFSPRDIEFATFMLEPTTTSQTIDSDAEIPTPTTKTIDSDATIQTEAEKTIDSDSFVGEETIKTIDSDASVSNDVEQTIQSDAFAGEETSKTIDSDSNVQVETTKTVDSDAIAQTTSSDDIDSDSNITATITKSINAKASIFQETTQTIDSGASIVIQQPSLQLYSSAAPTVPIGTATNPISFTGVIAGENNDHSDNPFFLWNDKGGSADSVDARDISITVVSFNVMDELMGYSNGTADQTFVTAFNPVIDDDATNHPISVKVNGILWSRVDDLSLSGPSDEDYEFDATTGTVTFGDNSNGKIPTSTNTIEITYGPQDVQHGDEVEQNLWFGVQSTGVISNPVTVDLERQISIDADTVQVSHRNLTSVTAVYLDTDPNGLATNYFTSGSFNASNGIITLGTSLPSTNTGVFVVYEYEIADDLQGEATRLGEGVTLQLENDIPSNNAKQLYFSLFPPASASPSGVMDIQFTIKINYNT